jgi:hypothetical protein
MKILATLICLFVFVALGSDVAAQERRVNPRGRTAQPRPQPPPTQELPVLPDIRSDPEAQAADVAIIVNLTAKELRFDAVPNPTVEFLDKAKSQTIWQTERFNLPDEVQPGVTYRNIGIRLKITSRLADIERIVAEALGERPISDVEEPPRPTTENQKKKP